MLLYTRCQGLLANEAQGKAKDQAVVSQAAIDDSAKVQVVVLLHPVTVGVSLHSRPTAANTAPKDIN